MANYIILHLKAIQTDKERDNDQNYWMFTYDFKEKKDSIFDREPEDIIREKNKNKLIVILYLLSALIFIYAMFFFTKLIYLILN